MHLQKSHTKLSASPSTSAPFSWARSLHRWQCISTQRMALHTGCAIAVFLSKRHFFLPTPFFFTGWLFHRLLLCNTSLVSFLFNSSNTKGGNYLTFSTYSFSLWWLPSENGDIFFRTSAVWWPLLFDRVRSLSLHIQQFWPVQAEDCPSCYNAATPSTHEDFSFHKHKWRLTF
jgi:hypothetical protein